MPMHRRLFIVLSAGIEVRSSNIEEKET